MHLHLIYSLRPERIRHGIAVSQPCQSSASAKAIIISVSFGDGATSP